MVIRLTGDPAFRKRATAWLNGEGIPHMLLFQAVSIDDPTNALRFQTWLASPAALAPPA